jgi:hypothetical protein
MDLELEMDIESQVPAARKKETSGPDSKKKKTKKSTNEKITSTFMDIPLNRNSSKSEMSSDERTANTKATSVVLSSSEDPFASRTGKTLIWRDVQMTLVRCYFYQHSSCRRRSRPFQYISHHILVAAVRRSSPLPNATSWTQEIERQVW